MAAGSPIVPIRIPGDLYAKIKRELASRRDAKKRKPISFSEWARQAFREKIAHANRSRKGKKKKVEPIGPFGHTVDSLSEAVHVGQLDVSGFFSEKDG